MGWTRYLRRARHSNLNTKGRWGKLRNDFALRALDTTTMTKTNTLDTIVTITDTGNDPAQHFRLSDEKWELSVFKLLLVSNLKHTQEGDQGAPKLVRFDEFAKSVQPALLSREPSTHDIAVLPVACMHKPLITNKLDSSSSHSLPLPLLPPARSIKVSYHPALLPTTHVLVN